MENDSKLLLIRENSEVLMPTRATNDSAGLDIYCPKDFTVSPGSFVSVSTGLIMSPPKGTYIRIAARSGLALHSGLMIGGGVVDPDYRGIIHVLLLNAGKEEVKIKKGDKFCQAILEKFKKCELVEVDELDETDRASQGFGSSGK